jgi:hypothetical protein
VDDSCLGSSLCSEFGGLLETPLATILQAFQVSFEDHMSFCSMNCMLSTKAKDMNIDEVVCYSDLHCVNLIKGPQVKYLIHVILIQDIKELLS